MRFLACLAAAAAAAAVPLASARRLAPREARVLYNGFKVFEIDAPEGVDAIIEKIANIDFIDVDEGSPDSYSVASAHPDGIKFFVDWHAFGHIILMPYGGNCSLRVANYDRQMELARQTTAIIESVAGSKYRYGPVCDVLYAASGGSMDYVYDIAGADIAWGWELSPASEAAGGFVLPAEKILPTAQENWKGVKWLLTQL
ncbi:hypothetical protein BN1723_006741 [Verticillium longisporum]|uniref:Peptidase M14 domain-containing protein n=1 Tax=Verticillium longisporum TaxID=100787 RepID=A0A0G4NHG2_VERLO|nr:hypothetical protein BN1723_006741 [Verticillium longisporum]